MKKNIILIICLIFSQLNHAQMTKLSTLSSAKFSDSSVIYDENKDIYGYLLLFEKNRTDKNEKAQPITRAFRKRGDSA